MLQNPFIRQWRTRRRSRRRRQCECIVRISDDKKTYKCFFFTFKSDKKMSLHFLWLYKIPNKTKNAPRRPPTITNRVHVQSTIHSKQSNERTSNKTNIKNCSQQLCYVFRLVCNLDKTSCTDDSGGPSEIKVL